MSKKWSTQSEDDKTLVLVSDEYSRKDTDDDTPRTDFLVIDKETHEKAHYSADGETGEVTERHDFERQ